MKEIITRTKNDLFNISFFEFLFKNKAFLFLFRTLLAFIFFYAIFYGFIYPQKGDNIFTTALFWGLFWPFFMVVTLTTFGRVFCGICPHGFLGKYITNFGLKKKIPKKLANPFIGLTLLIVFYWTAIYLFPGIYRVPLYSAIFFLVLTLLAFVTFYIFENMAYCKHICPLGIVTKVFSKNSFTKLETYKEGCSSCTTFDCAKACSYNLKPFTFEKKSSMEDCTLCMDCATSCENVAFKITPPSASLFKKFKIQKVEVWAVILLTAILSFGMTFKHALSRTVIADDLIWVKTATYLKTLFENSLISIDGLSVLTYSILLIVFMHVIGMYTASKIMKTSYEKTFYTLSYALIPLFIVGGLSHTLEFFIVHNISNIFNGFNQAFFLGMDTMEPLASRRDKWLLVFKIFTHIAYIWALILMAIRLRLLNSKRYLKIIAYPFASIVIISYMGLNFYTGYLFKTYGAVKKGGHSHNHSSMTKKDIK